MSRTSFSGPVYGALGILCQAQIAAVATGQTDLEIYEIDVPATEDWYVSRVAAWADGQGNAAATIDVEDDGTSILSSNITLVSDDSVEGTLASTNPRIAASSVVTVDITSGNTTAPDDIIVTVEGWRRFVGAPRGVLNPTP